MPARPGLALDDQLCFALYAASRALVRAYGPALGELGLTYPQYVTMLALWEADGPTTVTALTRRLHLDSGTLTPLLKRLEAAGLVSRQRDLVDERCVLVALTEAGAAMQGQAEAVPCRLGAEVPLDPAAAVSLRGQLRDLLGVLEGAARSAGPTPS
jgi:DNA-binding MarR family transcriptional regulator